MKNIYLLSVFTLLFCINGFSQDSSYVKPIYKVSLSDVKSAGSSGETKILPRKKESVYSCELSTDKKTAVITVLPSDKILPRETLKTKEEKK